MATITELRKRNQELLKKLEHARNQQSWNVYFRLLKSNNMSIAKLKRQKNK